MSFVHVLFHIITFCDVFDIDMNDDLIIITFKQNVYFSCFRTMDRNVEKSVVKSVMHYPSLDNALSACVIRVKYDKFYHFSPDFSGAWRSAIHS